LSPNSTKKPFATASWVLFRKCPTCYSALLQPFLRKTVEEEEEEEEEQEELLDSIALSMIHSKQCYEGRGATSGAGLRGNFIM